MIVPGTIVPIRHPLWYPCEQDVDEIWLAMPKQAQIDAIAAEIADRATTKAEALAAVVEALAIHHLASLDVVPLAEAVEHRTGYRLVPRLGTGRT